MDPPRLPNGTVVTVRVQGGAVLGDAFFNGHSDIAIRRLTDGERAFDKEWLAEALGRAVSLRKAIPRLDETTDAWRVVHAEGDGLSGLIADRYGEVLVLELHSAGWLPHVRDVLALLHEGLGTKHHRVSMGARSARLEGVDPFEESSEGCPSALKLREHGARFQVDFSVGHKTGFFCDQRENRREVAAWARGEMLDLCCYTGGFTVAAAVHGQVEGLTAVDLDEESLQVARTNLNLNQTRATLVHADAFDWLRQVSGAGRRFDTVVLDPPKFIPTWRENETGRGKYHDLNRLAFSVVKPGGLFMTSSCSGLLPGWEFRELVTTAARKEKRQVRLLRTTGAGPDHPVLLECPETEYLKCLWMNVW